MNNTRKMSLIVLLVSAFVIAACGSAAAPADEAAGADDGEVTYVDGIPQYGCLGTAEDAIVDLDCQEVTFAVENAYLPFNYIETETGMAGGWDYEVFPMIC